MVEPEIEEFGGFGRAEIRTGEEEDQAREHEDPDKGGLPCYFAGVSG
jgi:hypothetical protein